MISKNFTITTEQTKLLLAKLAKHESCTLEGLAAWMEQNPTAILVTDVKEDNMKALSTIYATIADAGQRVIPQIYQPENLTKAINMGYKNLI